MLNLKQKLDYAGAYQHTGMDNNSTLVGAQELFSILRYLGGVFEPVAPIRIYLHAVDRSKTQFETVDVTPTPPADLPPTLPLNYQIEVGVVGSTHDIQVASVANSFARGPGQFTGLLGLLQECGVKNPDAPDKPLEWLDIEHAFVTLNPTLAFSVQAEVASWIDPFMKAMGA